MLPAYDRVRQLRTVPAQPYLTQERVRNRHGRQIIVKDRPVPKPGRQIHRERTHRVGPRWPGLFVKHLGERAWMPTWPATWSRDLLWRGRPKDSAPRSEQPPEH